MSDAAVENVFALHFAVEAVDDVFYVGVVGLFVEDEETEAGGGTTFNDKHGTFYVFATLWGFGLV